MPFILLVQENSVSQTPAVDIVAVHGLYENASETWVDPETNILWLRDLYPYKRHKARVLLYSYQAKVLAFPGQGSTDNIQPYAASLVAELFAERRLANAHYRPIIFICHGFGGLLVKQALAASSTSQAKGVEHLRSIYISTYAIIFMGTPHHGIGRDSLLFQRPGDGPGPSQFVISLLRDSEVLKEISDSFRPLMKQFSIYNFWEGMETCVGNIKAYVVEEESAAPAWDHVEKCRIIATHSGMAKMRSIDDRGFRVILEALERYTSLAPEIIRLRWQKERSLLRAEQKEEAETLLRSENQNVIANNARTENINELFFVHRSPTSYFTGRQEHANFAKKKLAAAQMQNKGNNPNILVVYGLGGSGKTQFCLKYAWDNYPSYWGVFWIDASNEENLESDFASVGQQVGKGASFAAGMHWLSGCTKPWLLILDNADDPEMDLSRYFPAGRNGHILMTTRNPGAVEHATAGFIRFRGMDPEEAINLLLMSASPRDEVQSPNPLNRSLAQGIASELGYLALALTQAGATIRRRIYTLERYLNYYLGHRKAVMSNSRIIGADEANIIATWEIPFQRIVNRTSIEHKDAVDLLHIFAFMHFESIPEEIFKRSWNTIEGSKLKERVYPAILQSVWNEEAQARLRRAVGILRDYSIIDYEPKEGTCSLHPVVYAWARDRLDEEEQRWWLSCTMVILSFCISPNLEASGRKFRRLLLPHMDSCIRALKLQYPTFPDSIERAAEIEKFAWVYAENGLWSKSRALQSKIVEFRIRHLGKWHEATILAQQSLGNTYWNLFELRPAIKVQMQALKSLWWVRPSLSYWTVWTPWKPGHISYCTCLSDLTLTLWLAGERKWSKYVGERAVMGLIKRLGAEDPKTLTAMFNLARTYLHLNEYEKCHELLVWVLKKRKQFFGLDHLDTLMTRNELGILLCAQKQHLAVAERLVANVLESRRRILGDEHAYTLWSVNDLSKVFCDRGRPREAIKMLENIIPVVTRTLGNEHVGMSMTKSNLARAYGLCGSWEKAEELTRTVLASIPPDHPDWIHNMYGYVLVRIKLGQVDAAEHDCKTMLNKISKTKVLALDDPRTVAIAEILFKIYREQDRYQAIVTLKGQIPSLDENNLTGDRFDVYSVRKAPQNLGATVLA